jgi:uncharacterized membrane protein YjjB (DUF3815 family)
MMELSPSLTVQLVSCTAACVGFAYWFNVKGIQVMNAGIGAFFTWLVYALLYNAGYSNFLATLVGSIFVAAYAQVMARVNKAPATIFQTVCVFPLVPGPNLYYMMYCIVMEEHEMAHFVHIDNHRVGILSASHNGTALGNSGDVERVDDIAWRKRPLEMRRIIAVPLKGIEEIYTGITSMSIMLIYQFRRLRRQLHGRGKAVVIVYAILHIALLLCR